MQENLIKLEDDIDKTEKQSDDINSSKKYGKFTVNCVFAGNQSITELMNCYVDRKVSLKYGA